MKQKVITQADKQFMNIDCGKIGIQFLVTTEPKINLSPNRKSKKRDNFDLDEIELSFLSRMREIEKDNVSLFEVAFKIEEVPFKTYNSSAGLLICHYHEFNGYRIMRDLLVTKFNVDSKHLNSFKSTNGNNNFIPLEIRRKLSQRDLMELQKSMCNEVFSAVSKIRPELLRLLRSKFKNQMFEPMPYYKFSNVEVTMDIESAAGVEFGNREEIHARLLPRIVSSASGAYVDLKGNSVSHLVSTALAQDEKFPPYFKGILNDKTHVSIYSKYRSQTKGTGWLQRFERKFTHERNLSGADKINSVLRANAESGIGLVSPTFTSAEDLYEMTRVLFRDTFDLWFSHLNVPINRNSDEIRKHMGSVLQKYCRQNSLELYHRLCFPPWTFPASMIDRPDGFPRKSIKALEDEGIIKKRNKSFYELNLKYFSASHLKD